MTKKAAEYLAAGDRTYRARKLRSGEWCVWCDASEHEVEYDQRTIDRIMQAS